MIVAAFDGFSVVTAVVGHPGFRTISRTVVGVASTTFGPWALHRHKVNIIKKQQSMHAVCVVGSC